MIRTIFRSLRKTLKLRSISARLPYPSRELTLADVAGHSPFARKREKALRELFELVENDPILRVVLEKHKANREQIARAYELLSIGGCAQWVQGHWVAASALAFGSTLDFVLMRTMATPDSIAEEVALRLIRYFERGETGPVR